MDLWEELKKLTGYKSGNGGVDSYGVDHSGFSTSDELEYQRARLNRENQLAQNFEQMGIAEENYPQYGIDFWGKSSENNYGFGTSNIKQNVENVTNRLNNDGLDNKTMQTNTQQAHTDNYLVPQEAYTDPNWGQQTSAKLDNYMQNYNSYPGVTHTGIAAPFHDMLRNYKTMTDEQKWIGGDNFFHCKANYEATKRGPWGELVGKTVSAGREIIDGIKGDSLANIRKDWHADRMGWSGAKKGLSLRESCPTNPKAYVNPDDYDDMF